MPNLKLSDLEYGTLNNIRENDSNASGDRRRTSTSTAIRFGAEKAFEKNTLANINEFNGIVLHHRIVTYASYQNRASLLATFVKVANEEQAENVDFPSFVYKVLIPELEPRPTPLSLDDPVIATYPDIYADFESETPLEKGQLVVIKYEDVGNLFNPRITRVIDKPLSIGGCDEIESTQKSFKKGKPKVLRDSTNSTSIDSTNVVYTTLLPNLEELNSNQYVTSESPVPSTLTGIVEGELEFWKGKKETNSGVYLRLKTYWDNLGWFPSTEGKDPAWTPSGVPWSAAYISYVMTKVDSGFPKSAAHFGYAKSAKEGAGNWTLWKTSGNSIKAQIGDILVKPRTGKGSSKTSTHGDVVYKIEDGHAFLSGGNLGDTAKIVGKLQLNENGNYKNYSSYEVLLKKNGKILSS